MNRFIRLLLVCVCFSNCAYADQVDALYQNLKARNATFEFRNKSSEVFWSWIEFNLNEVTRSQIEWGTRKIGEDIFLRVISGQRKEITVSGNMPIMEAMAKALELYGCVAILGKTSVIVIPEEIRIDARKYKLLEERVYRVK